MIFYNLNLSIAKKLELCLTDVDGWGHPQDKIFIDV